MICSESLCRRLALSVFISVHPWFEIFLTGAEGRKRNEPRMNTDEHR
jgi:hypothetical protein